MEESEILNLLHLATLPYYSVNVVMKYIQIKIFISTVIALSIQIKLDYKKK